MASNNLAHFTYDANGNMKTDGGKAISNIEYNHLNLPKRVTWSNGNWVEWAYDANGTRLKKTTSAGAVKHYINGIEYSGSTIEAVYHAEGRASLQSGTYWYEYTLRDHLGNSRVMFADLNGNNEVTEAEILQQNHYYPFGMNMEGSWAGGTNRYQYNGKELNTDFGLDWMDYGARWYDASMGRWGQVDPLAEPQASYSPYHYVANNPIRLVDPTGMMSEAYSFAFPDWEAMQESHQQKIKETKDRKKQNALKSIVGSSLKALNSSKSSIKAIHFVFESNTREIYKHTVDAQKSHPAILHMIKGNPDLRDKNRKEALGGYSGGDPSPDEYPYASTYEGGCGASVRYVPLIEQKRQGAQLSIISRLLEDKDAFAVVPVPETKELENVLNALERYSISLGNSSVIKEKKNELRMRAVWRGVRQLPAKAATRFLPPIYIGPGSPFEQYETPVP